ncbi:MAG: exodeoxyribonuclease VII small subunit [Desulfuromusa sp.]
MVTKNSFEVSLQKLEEAVDQLESGDLTLDQALKVFSGGVKQAETCRKSLSKVELQVQQLLQNDDGTFQREPFNGES